MNKHPLQPSWSASSHEERFAAIARHLSGKKVLDVGAASGFRRPDWMHAALTRHAGSVVGVDIDKSAVEEIRQRGGYDVRLVDAQAMDVGETFDVVFAGELIEHLSNFDAFMASVRRHLRPNGIFLLTTPNAFCVSNFVYRIGFQPRVHPEHTCWFCSDTITALLQRGGFAVESVEYVRHRTPGRLRAVAATLARSLFPERLAWRTLLVSARMVA
ncbi:MAG: class I SAM-dependent methyltransferase [Deltaproteobacteria bacterium]|nr:class I SAM-dependent methyltransferase [Deltaproteobacteria bacterium]